MTEVKNNTKNIVAEPNSLSVILVINCLIVSNTIVARNKWRMSFQATVWKREKTNLHVFHIYSGSPSLFEQI